MHKIESMFLGMLSYLFRNCILLSLCLCSGLFAQEDKPVIGVLGLDNGGGITGSVIDTVCNRISALIDKTQKYYVLQRDFIPPVLEEQGYIVTSGACSKAEGLSAAGTLLSADQMVGGKILKGESGITLTLQRIQVSNLSLLASRQITTVLPRQEFLDTELPKMVSALLEDSQEKNQPVASMKKQNRKKETVLLTADKTAVSIPADNPKEKINPVIVEKRKKRVPLLIIFSSVVASGAAAAGAYVYHKDHQSNSPVISTDLPLGELPERRR